MAFSFNVNKKIKGGLPLERAILQMLKFTSTFDIIARPKTKKNHLLKSKVGKVQKVVIV